MANVGEAKRPYRLRTWRSQSGDERRRLPKTDRVSQPPPPTLSEGLCCTACNLSRDEFRAVLSGIQGSFVPLRSQKRRSLSGRIYLIVLPTYARISGGRAEALWNLFSPFSTTSSVVRIITTDTAGNGDRGMVPPKLDIGNRGLVARAILQETLGADIDTGTRTAAPRWTKSPAMVACRDAFSCAGGPELGADVIMGTS